MDLWQQVLRFPRVQGVLGNSGAPSPLADGVMAGLTDRLLERLPAAEAFAVHNVGDRVRIVAGPFRNMVGVVQGAMRHKVLVTGLSETSVLTLTMKNADVTPIAEDDC